MITPPSGARIYLACGVTDKRKGFDGLVAQVERMLQLDPYAGSLFIFRGRRGDLIKGIYFDGQGLVLFAKRLEKGRFVSDGLCQHILGVREHALDRAARLKMIIDRHR